MRTIISRGCTECDGTVTFDRTRKPGIMLDPILVFTGACDLCGLWHNYMPENVGPEMFWANKYRVRESR